MSAKIWKGIIWGLVVALVVLFIAGLNILGNCITVTGTISKVWTTTDSDGDTVYEGTMRGNNFVNYTVSVNRQTKVGDSWSAKVFRNDRESYLFFTILIAGVLSIIGLVISGVMHSKAVKREHVQKQQKLKERRRMRSRDPEKLFGKGGDPSIPALTLVRERGLQTEAMASELTRREWDDPEVRAAVLRPDYEWLQNEMLADAGRRVRDYLLKHCPRGAVTRERLLYWTKYEVGQDRDTATVQVKYNGYFKGESRAFDCVYTYSPQLPVGKEMLPIPLPLYSERNWDTSSD